MKPSYAPDNTRSSVVVILLLAAGVTIVAVLLGLSEKPDVQAIGISVTAAEADEAVAALPVPTPLGSTEVTGTASTDTAAQAQADTGADGAGDTIELDELGQPIVGGDAATSGAVADDGTAATAIPIPLPTSTPVPTPEVAAAVEVTTESADDAAAEAELDALAAPQISPGTIAGQSFTRPDEDDGATVARNELTITLNADGTGTFAGVLDMTLVDSTHIVVAMSGPVRWSTETPQVSAELSGSYSLDSPIDAEDVESTTADLTISSLGSGSGSLCTPTCYGFTFPQQTGF